MLVALGEVDLNYLFEGMKHMAEDKKEITTNMIPLLSDKIVQEMFLTRGPKHRDGWGMAFLEKDNFILKKSLRPIYEDVQAEEIKKIKTNFVMLHARFRSIGENKLENNAPFQNRESIFCHNGTIRQGLEFNEKKFKPLGDTDSERFFLSILSKNLPIKEAIKDAFNGRDLKPNSNIIFSNKENTYIYSSSRTLPNYFRMQIGRTEGSLIISSEKFHYPGISWEELPFERVIAINHTTFEITEH